MNHDISQPVPQGSDGAQDAENSRIAAIADQLERLCAVHEAQCGDSQQNVSCFETVETGDSTCFIKSNLIPAEVTREQAAMKYAEEADVLNVAMFGMTAKQWREANPELKGNIRDYATINELICLSNMENINAVLINDGMPQGERLVKLNQIAILQMQVLEDNESRKLLK